MNLILQNLLQSLRALRTQGWQVIISALGLAVSIVCLTYSVNWLWSETHYDAFRPNSEELYILQVRDSADTQRTGYFAYPEVEQIRQRLHQHGDSVGMCRILGRPVQYERINTASITRRCVNVSMTAEALRTLDVEVLRGDPDEALQSQKLMITDRMATDMFGHTDVVGQTLMASSTKKVHTVGAVIKANEGKSVFPYDCIKTEELPEWVYTNYSNVGFSIVLRSKDITASLRALDGIILPYEETARLYAAAPLATFPHMTGYTQRTSLYYKVAEYSFLKAYFYPLAFVIVSLLLLLSALANLVAVNTSICLSRTREYALRRSLGGSTWQNAQWLLTGIVPTLLLAVLLATVAQEWAVKMQWIEIDTYRVQRIFWLCVSAAVVGSLLGMLYPIAKMQRIYKRNFSGSGAMGHSHSWLVAVQCVACAFLLFLSWGMSSQLRSMMQADLGLDTHNLLRLGTGWQNGIVVDNPYNFQYIFNTLPQEFVKQRGAGIVDAIAVPTDIFNRTSTHRVIIGDEKAFAGETEQKDEGRMYVEYIEVPYVVQRFFKLRTVGGRQMRDMSAEEPQMQVYGNSLYLQQTGCKPGDGKRYYLLSGYENINTTFDSSKPFHWNNKEIVLVDEANLSMNDFHRQPTPTIYVGVPDGHPCAYQEWDAIYIRYADGRLDDAEAAVRKVLADMDIPENGYLLTTFEEYVARSYKEDIFYANLVTWLTVFSFLITLAGVFSTLLYTLRLQRRSMAIRRVMGAEFGDVFYGTLRPYVIYAVLGAAIAFAPAALLMNKWMSYFSYGTAPGLGLMLCILLMMLTVITLIVLWQVNKSMNEKPVDVLRPEA